MTSARAILALCRVSNLPTVWCNAGASAILCGSRALPTIPLLSLTLLYCGGMALNDCCDTAEDSLLRPDRPIPSGAISRPGAALVAAVLLVSGVAILAAAPSPAGMAAGGILALLIVAYDLLHARTALAPVMMAGCRFGCYAVTSVALSGSLTASAAAGGAVMFLYVMLLSRIARTEKETGTAVSRVPALLRGMPLIDGAVVFLAGRPLFLAAAGAAALLTTGWQRRVRGG